MPKPLDSSFYIFFYRSWGQAQTSAYFILYIFLTKVRGKPKLLYNLFYIFFTEVAGKPKLFDNSFYIFFDRSWGQVQTSRIMVY